MTPQLRRLKRVLMRPAKGLWTVEMREEKRSTFYCIVLFQKLPEACRAKQSVFCLRMKNSSSKMTCYFFLVPVSDFTCVFAQMRSEKSGKRTERLSARPMHLRSPELEIMEFSCLSSQSPVVPDIYIYLTSEGKFGRQLLKFILQEKFVTYLRHVHNDIQF
jgi:hypothetical protein